MPFLFLLYIVACLDRINVGFAALQIRQQLGFTDGVYGLGAGNSDRRSIHDCGPVIGATLAMSGVVVLLVQTGRE